MRFHAPAAWQQAASTASAAIAAAAEADVGTTNCMASIVLMDAAGRRLYTVPCFSGSVYGFLYRYIDDIRIPKQLLCLPWKNAITVSFESRSGTQSDRLGEKSIA